MAFSLIDKHCEASTQGDNRLEIVGFYSVHATGTLEMSASTKAIADKILANCPSATVWGIDLAKLHEKKCALVGNNRGKDDWKSFGPDAVFVAQPVLSNTARVVSEMKYIDLVDFDDHLADVQLDWLNADLFR